MGRVGQLKGALAVAALGIAAIGSAQFSESEKAQIIGFWSAPGRYSTGTPSAFKDAPFQVRLTPEGSLWLWAYNARRGVGKGVQVPGAVTDEQRTWESWIEAKVAYDRWMAQVSANVANQALGFAEAALSPVPAVGPIPESLRFMVGDAPLLAMAVQPSRHSVVFEDGLIIDLIDNPNMRARYPYYRSAQGVMSGGMQVKNMPAQALAELFGKANLSESVQKVMKAVSLLEGGFDSVNTYDTGFVSVGFIQFACLSKGAGSLGAVLQRMKDRHPAAFERDFRRYGIDVADGSLVAMDLVTGETAQGYDAAKLIIRDKRLIAAFQHAGRTSEEFKVAQLQIAKEQYYPDADVVMATMGGQAQSLRIADFIKSEAGMATLMDQKVNTGRFGNLASIVTEIASANGLRTAADLAPFEIDIIRRMRFRKDFLLDDTLTQPTARKKRASSSKRKGN